MLIKEPANPSCPRVLKKLKEHRFSLQGLYGSLELLKSILIEIEDEDSEMEFMEDTKKEKLAFIARYEKRLPEIKETLAPMKADFIELYHIGHDPFFDLMKYIDEIEYSKGNPNYKKEFR